MKKSVLILGSTGKFGSHCKTAFAKSGWDVRIYRRGEQNMAEAAMGVDVIVNGLNPPNYSNWETALPAIINDVVNAAKVSGATIMQPGNVYNFGDFGAVWDENSLHNAKTKKGQVRSKIEKTLREAAQREGVQTIILRAGDFIDTSNSGNWFDISLVAKLKKGIFGYPGKTDITHAWAFLPDLARAAVQLADKRDKLGVFEDIPFAGHTLTAIQIKHGLESVTGDKFKFKIFPWFMIRLVSPFWPMGRELLEMRYLWNMPHALDNRRLLELLPDFRVTELDNMLRSAIGQQMPEIPEMSAAAVLT